jgi:hypothetical protein
MGIELSIFQRPYAIHRAVCDCVRIANLNILSVLDTLAKKYINEPEIQQTPKQLNNIRQYPADNLADAAIRHPARRQLLPCVHLT